MISSICNGRTVSPLKILASDFPTLLCSPVIVNQGHAEEWEWRKGNKLSVSYFPKGPKKQLKTFKCRGRKKSSVESRKIMKWVVGTSNQNNPREVQLVSPCRLHFHSKRFQQGSCGLALPLCFSAWALTGKQHLKLFSDLLLSLQLYPCHWTTQSYWTSQRPAEGIQVLPCSSLFVTLLSLKASYIHWCYIPMPSPLVLST